MRDPREDLVAEDVSYLRAVGCEVLRYAIPDDWLLGLGVPLRRERGTRIVWAPRWVNLFCGLFTGNPRTVALARAARDPEWAEAALSAYDLGGSRGVADLVRSEP